MDNETINTIYLLAAEQQWKTGRVVSLDHNNTGLLVISGEAIRYAPTPVRPISRWTKGGSDV